MPSMSDQVVVVLEGDISDPTMETTADNDNGNNHHGGLETTTRGLGGVAGLGGRRAPTTSFLDETYLESSMASIDWSVTSRSDSDSDDSDSDSDDDDDDDSSVSSMSSISNPSAAKMANCTTPPPTMLPNEILDPVNMMVTTVINNSVRGRSNNTRSKSDDITMMNNNQQQEELEMNDDI